MGPLNTSTIRSHLFGIPLAEARYIHNTIRRCKDPRLNSLWKTDMKFFSIPYIGVYFNVCFCIQSCVCITCRSIVSMMCVNYVSSISTFKHGLATVDITYILRGYLTLIVLRQSRYSRRNMQINLINNSIHKQLETHACILNTMAADDLAQDYTQWWP